MEDMTRRSALLAAAAIGVAAAESVAGEDGQSKSGQAPQPQKTLLLHIVLPDGQTVDMKASELVIDFGGASRLLVKPDGLMQPGNQGRRVPDPLDPGFGESPTPIAPRRTNSGPDPFDRAAPKPGS
jgi:hypothetical protein